MRMMPVNTEHNYHLNWKSATMKSALFQFIIAIVAVIGLYAVGCSVCGGNNGYFSFFFDFEYRHFAYISNHHTTLIYIPVLYAYSLFLLVIHSFVVGVGILRKRRWAWKWARITPIMTAPIWATFAWYLAEFFTLKRANFIVSSDETANPLILIRDIRIAVLYCIIAWFAISYIYVHKLKRSEAENGFNGEDSSSLKSRAARAAVLVIILVLLLLNFKLPDKRMLIHDTASYGWTNITNLLCVLGQNVNARTTGGLTPLHFAAELGRSDTVVSLLKHGANINLKDVEGHTAITFTTMGDMSYRLPNASSYDTFIELINNGADVCLEDESDLASSYYGLENSVYLRELVKLMVEHGVPINAVITNDYDKSPLLGYAVECGKPSDVDYLLAHGAKMYPALVIHANPKMLKHLIDRGFDVNSRDEDGKTPLHYVLDRDQMSGTSDGKESALLLLKHGAKINIKDNDGHTVLALAAKCPGDELVNILFSYAVNHCIYDPNSCSYYNRAKDSR